MDAKKYRTVFVQDDEIFVDLMHIFEKKGCYFQMLKQKNSNNTKTLSLHS